MLTATVRVIHAAEYSSQNPQPSHFTQVVWKNSKQVGCAVADCTTIFPAKYGVSVFALQCCLL